MESEPAERKLLLTRLYEAPTELVFTVWTDPDHMKHYWGPHGWSIPLSEIDPRPGGTFRYVMRSPEGEEHMVEGIVSEIEEPRRIVTISELGADGSHPPVRVVTAVSFEERDGGTLLSVDTKAVADSGVIDSATEGMEQHWGEHLDRLGAYLAGQGDKPE